MADEVEKSDECFIVGVIGKSGSEQRIHADWLFEGVVRPTFTAHYPEFRVLRADHMKTPGIITSQIIEKLLNARLVIADLTFLNPNVFYEIGIRHMTGKPIVHVHKAGELIPFDISTFLSMEYSIQQHSDMVGAGVNLKTLIDNVLAPSHQMENPVTQAQGRANFEATASAPDKLLLAQVEALTARLNAIERRAPADVFLRPATVRRSIVGGVGAGRFYGGGTALPPHAVTFSVREGTSPAVLSTFMEENVFPFASNSVVIRQSTDGGSYTVHHELGAIGSDLMDSWEKEAHAAGIYLIPF